MTQSGQSGDVWHHGKAALTAFLATPVIGLSQIFLAEAVATGQSPLADVYQTTAWLMIFSVFVSWLVLPLLLPLTDLAARRFGAAYWLAVPAGAVIGGIVSLFFSGLMINEFNIASALTGAIMAAIYCAALRWFAAG